MKSRGINKVAMPLADKPMILHTVELLKKIKVKEIIVVVGFAKDSVVKILDGGVIFAEQKKRLGTAHAVAIALKKLNKDIDEVLVLNGDDSAFYTKEVIGELIGKHCKDSSSFTFLTIKTDNPKGLGRIVRDKNGKLSAVVEEKDATPKQRGIEEVNPACYLFNTDFLRKYIKKVEKSAVTGEYYLTSLIDLGIKNKEKIETLRVENLVWRGVNTHDELREAEKLIREKHIAITT
ncbi:sugar phosphate nucleotidyltransferase [Patescibacteria group bacterium]|nr:sugar phosphate nucleotidyltransferase [Patescibacteria group bacterium]